MSGKNLTLDEMESIAKDSATLAAIAEIRESKKFFFIAEAYSVRYAALKKVLNNWSEVGSISCRDAWGKKTIYYYGSTIPDHTLEMDLGF